jgi:hypothetical protein
MVVRRFTSLEQSMVAVERIKEYSVLVRSLPWSAFVRDSLLI